MGRLCHLLPQEGKGSSTPLSRRHCLRQTRSVCARERSDEAIHSFFMRRDGLLRFARNDGVTNGELRFRLRSSSLRRDKLPTPHESSSASAEKCAGGTGIGNFSYCFGKFTGR